MDDDDTQDYNYQHYYPNYWYSGETTGFEATDRAEEVNPLDSLLDKIDTEIKVKLDGKSKEQSNENNTSTSTDSSTTFPIDSAPPLPSYPPPLPSYPPPLPPSSSSVTTHTPNYTASARFNARTGRFQRDPTLNPERFSADAKAMRQMSFFFNYEQYAEERGRKRLKGEQKEKKLN
ncbi:6730_t:CDS:2 [Paraglomus occultum]|uniref:6730_t:CDS:1 n=1 Tax=Paraglomus occultum TaxID=144539 RepID=A0A9N8VTC7_9GLOM|nr:6730_t:CDS:2 [Paraglomus occultum]